MAVRREFHVTNNLTGVTVESLFNPHRDPGTANLREAGRAPQCLLRNK